MKTLINTLAGTALLVAATGLGTAQSLQSDDYVTSNLDGAVMLTNPRTGRISTLATIDGAANAVAMSPYSNSWVYVLREDAQGDEIVQVSPQGFVRTEVSLPTAGQKSGMIVDVDRSWVVTSDDGRLYRVEGTTLTTLASGLGALNAITLDVDTGDYVVGSGTNLLRIDRKTLAATTLARMPARVNGVAFHPPTGHFAVVLAGTSGNVRLVDNGGTLRAVTGAVQDNAIFVDGRNGDILVAGRGSVAHYDAKLTRTGLRSIPGIQAGLMLYGSRKIQGTTKPTKGSVYNISLRFIDSPNANYGGALFVQGLRPGIPVAGRKINANFNDPLLYLSSRGKLEGLFTQNIFGTTDAIGGAEVKIQVPALMKTGAKLYFVCNVVNGQKPGNLDLGNTIVIPVD